MATDKDEHKKENSEGGTAQPDPETLHTTDPQEHMEGPISSLVKKTGEAMESDKTAKEDEDK